MRSRVGQTPGGFGGTVRALGYATCSRGAARCPGQVLRLPAITARRGRRGSAVKAGRRPSRMRCEAALTAEGRARTVRSPLPATSAEGDGRQAVTPPTDRSQEPNFGCAPAVSMTCPVFLTRRACPTPPGPGSARTSPARLRGRPCPEQRWREYLDAIFTWSAPAARGVRCRTTLPCTGPRRTSISCAPARRTNARSAPGGPGRHRRQRGPSRGLDRIPYLALLRSHVAGKRLTEGAWSGTVRP